MSKAAEQDPSTGLENAIAWLHLGDHRDEADLGEYYDSKNDGRARVQVDLSFVFASGREYGDD